MKKIISFALIATIGIVWSLVPVTNKTEAATTDSPALSNDDLKTLSKMYDEAESGTKEYSDSKEIKDLDGEEVLYTLNTDTTKVVKKDTEKETVTINITNDIKKEYPNGKVENSTEKNEISYNKKGEIFVNGEKLSADEMNQSPEEAMGQMSTMSLASGGKKWLTYYKQTGSKTYDVTAYKKPRNMFMDESSGTPKKKTLKYGTVLVDFKNQASTVASARNEIVGYTATIAGALTVATVSAWTVIGLLGSGGTAGVAAVALYNASNTGKSAMLEAYNLI